MAKAEPKAFQFGYRTEEQIHSDIVWVPLVKLPGCEIGITTGVTNRASALRDDFTRQAQSKKKYEKGEAMTGTQRLKVNDQLVSRECFHGMRVIKNHEMPIEHDDLGLFENTVACREKWLLRFPEFRVEVNQLIADITEKAAEAEEESAKN